jgi:6-pyruvoyl-tetrahydropterin synthase
MVYLTAMPIGTLVFVHDIQVGHRLFTLPGKCQQIHGHSMTVNLRLQVHFNGDGYAVNDELQLLEFGAVKKVFRGHLDDFYDHHLLLNENDPWANATIAMDGSNDRLAIPGLRKVSGDPSTENIAFWIARYCAEEFRCLTVVEVEETATNAVVRTAQPSPRKANTQVFIEREGHAQPGDKGPIESPSGWVGL